MNDLLKGKPDYAITTTSLGRWRRFMYPSGMVFAEYRSHAELFGLPWVHYTHGISPETGRRIVAKGLLAVGRFAVGGIAVGQLSAGIISIAQLGVGLLFGLAPAAFGLHALGQVAVGGAIAAGQLAAAPTAIGQLGVGEYALAQKGVGTHVWSPARRDPEAIARFSTLWRTMTQPLRPAEGRVRATPR